jgi:hypothetical protein
LTVGFTFIIIHSYNLWYSTLYCYLLIHYLYSYNLWHSTLYCYLLIHYLYIDFSTSWIVLDNMKIKNDDDDDDDLWHVKEPFTHDKRWVKAKLDATFGHPQSSLLCSHMPVWSHSGDLWQTGVGTTWNYPTQLRYGGQPDTITRPSGAWIESELQIFQPVKVKSTNDLTVKVHSIRNQPTTNHLYNWK